MLLSILLILYFVVDVLPEIYFFEEFNDESYTNRWIESTHRGIDQGKFQLGAGKYFGDYWKERGLQTSQNSKYYGISARFEKSFSNKNKPLVIQYQLKIEEPIQCGGGYIKILGTDFDPITFHGHTPYKIMFGPDICGTTKKIVHVILNYKDKYYLNQRDIKCMDDSFSHLYTLIIWPNNTYCVLIDNKKVKKGKLVDHWHFLPPKTIKDPNIVKPIDWVENEKIYDPNDTKPHDWDQPRTIPDLSVSQPTTWDDEVDGVWEPPIIDNPLYKGEWKQKQIDNPLYKGPWVHPTINNPDYYEDSEIYVQTEIGGVGLDIWQVNAGSIFDNILITDDPALAFEIGENTWRKAYEDEVKAHDFEITHARKQREQFERISAEKAQSKEDEIVNNGELYNQDEF